VLVSEALHTFQLDHQYVFDEDITKVFSDIVAFVGYCKRSLGGSPDATKAEFSEQSPLVDFLEKPGAERVGDFKDGAQHASVSESKHPCSSAANIYVPCWTDTSQS